MATNFGGLKKGFLLDEKAKKKAQPSSPDSSTLRKSPSVSNPKDNKTTERNFGGFKKGFLLGEKPNKKTRYSSPDSSTSRQSSEALSTKSATSMSTESTASVSTQSTASVSTQSAAAIVSAQSTAALSSQLTALSSNQPSSSASSSAASSSNPKQTESKTKGFGGFESGFLSKKGAKKQSTVGEDNAEDKKNSEEKKSSNTQKAEEKPNIDGKSKQTDDPLSLSEVQAAMGDSEEALKEKADRVTKELLERIEQNDSIKQKLQDPKNVEVINQFQKDPKSAMEKYNSSLEIQQFFTEFRDFLSLGSNCDHQSDASMSGVRFTDQNYATFEDEKKRLESLSNLEMNAEVLMDPEIQQLLLLFTSDPERAQRLIHDADDNLKKKLEKLSNSGLLPHE